MRAVIRKAQGQQPLMRSNNQGDSYCATVSSGGSVPYLSHIPNYENSLTNGSSFSGGDFSNLASRMCNKDGSNVGKMAKNMPVGPNSESQVFTHPNSENLNTNPQSLETEPPLPDPSNTADSYVSEKSKNTTALSNVLQNVNSNASNQYQNKRQANTMLMSMLSDVPAANASSTSFPFLGSSDNSSSGSKSRKRKKRSDTRSPSGSTGRSPKRKLSEDDYIRDRSTPDGEICDSPLAYEACSSLPASLPSTVTEQHHLSNAMGSMESLIKTEPSVGFPQRSASTDSYLIHDEYQNRQVLNINDSSHLSEGGTSSNPDLIRSFSQVKSQYFGADNMMEVKSYLSASEGTYGDSAAITSDIDMEDDNSFSMDSNQSNSMPSKSNSSEKPPKKKKSKEKSEGTSESLDISIVKTEVISSDESSIGDMSIKSFSEAENSQSEDSSTSSKSNTSHISQQMFLGTSLKIAKSGDGHKVSKSESKVKQKDSKRTSSSTEGGESSKKKSDAKKERKRRKAEGSGSASNRSPVRTLHLNLDSSLMPPPSSSSETAMMVSSSDTQPIRPITLNVKSAPVVSSSSNFQAKSPVYSKKSSSLSNTSGNVSKNSSSKSSSSEKSVKPSPPRSGHFPSIKVSSSESEPKRSSNPTTVKIPSKHKQSSSSKSNSGGSSSGSTHSGGRSSPSKVKSATVKFKNYPLPTSVTLTPIVTKVSSSPTSMSAMLPTSDPLILQAAMLNPPSPPGKAGSNNSKANKSALRSRSLNAVIDKLKVSATNAQYSVPDGMDLAKCENAVRSEMMIDRKESKIERKDNCKDSRDTLNLSKGSESKSKYSSSEQFTVKQSSQGIKLTVTKTRSSDGSSKSSKSKQSTKSSSAVTSSSVGKASSSSGSSSTSKNVNVSPASKKVYSSSSSNVNVSSKMASSSSSQPKQNSTSSQKISSPSSSSVMSPRTGNPANNLSKSVSKHITSSSQSKVSGSSKGFDKPDKKSVSDVKTTPNEIKESVTTSTVNMVTSLMPPPSLSKSIGDSSRSLSGNTPKRIDESSRQSPRHTPTRDMNSDESDGERAFRFLLNQSKTEPPIGLEPSNLTCRPSQMIQAPVDYSKDYSKIDMLKSEMEDKGPWVSSSSDIKTLNMQSSGMKLNLEQVNLDELNCLPMNDLECKLNAQIEVSSSKHDNVNNANVVSSSEEITKPLVAQLKAMKQSKRTTDHNEDSSPDECLVIDCDNDEKWSSPCLESNIVLNVLEDKLDKSEMSPGNFALSQSPLIKSPAQILTSNHSMPRSISYVIDDELMNEAVMPIEK